MKSIDSIKFSKNASTKKALEIINSGAMQIALVVDENNRLIGTVTDGDVRRGLLAGLDLNSSIESVEIGRAHV